MAMEKLCEVCGTAFTAQRATARYCSGRCRAKASRMPKQRTRPVLSAVPPLTAEQRAELPTMVEVTLRELREWDREHTVPGQVALLIARRLDGPSTDTGSSVAALIKEYRVTMAKALEGAQKELDPLQQIRARMAERGHVIPGNMIPGHGA